VEFSGEDGHHWQRSYDALGWLTGSWSLNFQSTPAIETDYRYDGLGIHCSTAIGFFAIPETCS